MYTYLYSSPHSPLHSISCMHVFELPPLLSLLQGLLPPVTSSMMHMPLRVWLERLCAHVQDHLRHSLSPSGGELSM